MIKNSVIEALMLQRDVNKLKDEIAILRQQLASVERHSPIMNFVPIDSPTSSAEPSPAPTPDPIPPPSPLCEPRLDAIESEPEPRLAESLPSPPPFPERHTIFSPTPTRRCVGCGFAKSCLRCKHSA